MGSQKWVKTEVHREITEPIERLQRQGFQVFAAHCDEGSAMDYREVDYTRPTALVLGAEKRGVSGPALDIVDGCVVVPMMGMSESYNVSVACAIILAEAQRQRAIAGLYRQCRLPDEEYHRLLFEWCQPVIARFCRARDLAYPELHDTGHLVNPQQFSALANRS